MTKQQAAAEFVSLYRWCAYHDMSMGSELTVLGWRCSLDVVRTEDAAMIMNEMRKV